MALLGLRTNAAPRLRPELNDTGLSKVCKRVLRPPATPDAMDFLADVVGQLIDEAGIDWERRWLRLSVLAECSTDSGFDRSWLSRRPRNPDALILSAWANALRAGQAGPATDLRSAVRRCQQACELRPHDPLPLVALIGLLGLLRIPHRQVEVVWREVVLRDPWNREAHLQMLRYLSMDELGSPGLVREFVDVQRAHMPADAPAAALELTDAVMAFQRATSRDQLNAILADLWWRRPHADEVLARAAGLTTRPGFLRHASAPADLNLLAYALIQAGRVPEAAPVFRLLGPTVVAWPWNRDGDPVEQFTRWRGHARRGSVLRSGAGGR